MFVLSLLLLASAQDVLPGTQPLTETGDLATRMVDGIHSYLDRDLESAERSQRHGSRERLREIIGAVDPRVPPALERERIGEGPGYVVYAVRWKTFADVDGEGLLLDPAVHPRARIVLIPDADETPEAIVERRARPLVESGCQVLIPVLINRADKWSGIPGVRMTNQPHREWIYRMAFETGRHIIGYEVQKVLAAVDWFEQQGRSRIAVAGYGEGGLLALYAAALDPRIDVALVSGYFQGRRDLWREPVYRDVWSFSRDFGDLELAAMIAPRKLIVEAAPAPEVTGPPAETPDRKGATPNGAIATPPTDVVREAARRAGAIFTAGDRDGTRALLRALHASPSPPRDAPKFVAQDAAQRQKRQFDQLVNHTQIVIREARRPAIKDLREVVWNDLIGRLPNPLVDAHPRTRLIYDEPKFRGYEVTLDVLPSVFAYGILLVPKDLRPGERRPVVVCQHGLEGRAQEVADPHVDSHFYHHFAAQLADQGFITYAPQNPYIGEDRFRLIQRKAHPLKLSLFSFILAQNQTLLAWLQALPFVDPGRIGFYGLSYGGKTAMRVPPLLPGYALSICSGDFNDWIRKVTSVDSKYSYMSTREYDMLEWNFAHIVNYSDLANLMAPRPFMVERGRQDGVAPDEWVAAEFQKIRGGHAEIEFFDGPHTINGKGTFEFLRKHLGWDQPR